MNDAIVIIAAMPGELKPLVRSWAALETREGVDGWQHPSAPIMAFCAGMGAGPATRAFARARQVCDPVQLLSVGWAGALREELVPGSIVRASLIRDLNTGEMYAGEGNGGMLLTSSRVALREDKHRLAGTYDGAVAVDMEAATLARLAFAHDLGFRAIKAISDTLDEDLPDMNPFITQSGSVRNGTLHRATSRRSRGTGAHWQSSASRRSLPQRLFAPPSPTRLEWIDHDEYRSSGSERTPQAFSVPETQSAAVYRAVNDVRIETVPVPEIGAGEVLIRIDTCGICGTDLKKIHTGSHSAPRIFGHEMAGTIAKRRRGRHRLRRRRPRDELPSHPLR